MSRSPFRLAISLLALACAHGCTTSHTCGPGSTSGGNVAVAATSTLEYGSFKAGTNNDCPDPTAPAGVISLTISGPVVGGGAGFFTVCIGRPDLLGTAPLSLATQVKFEDVSGTDAQSCTYSVDATTPPSGTLTATGVCGDGADHAGFAMTVTGTVQLTRDCAGTKTSMSAPISGTVAVHGP
jgi:hypothetical protein